VLPQRWLQRPNYLDKNSSLSRTRSREGHRHVWYLPKSNGGYAADDRYRRQENNDDERLRRPVLCILLDSSFAVISPPPHLDIVVWARGGSDLRIYCHARFDRRPRRTHRSPDCKRLDPRRSRPWVKPLLTVNAGRSMATASEPLAHFSKSLKYGHFLSSVPKSLGQQALRRIRSLERISAIWPLTRSTAPSSNRCRAWPISARQLGWRIVAIEEVGGPKATIGKL
jgi:hypothetical protein